MLEELRSSLLEVTLLDDTLLELLCSKVPELVEGPLELDLPLLEDTLPELSTSLPLSDDFDLELLEPSSLPLLELASSLI